jgi:putative peptide modification system cyclase
MNEMTHRPSIDAPQLRTLLLTDLCDSTTLVERIGDVQAATLFRDHDRLVLDLQQRWRGRLIDRSDGLLLLFERPIDGLGFALDYIRELREMGDARGHELRARAGLHVGEVLTWRNSEEAVQVGAKPLEVEGLAKPMAARLMAMARPGQILLSAVAEPLAHRAARELGERGQHLLWKSHGRWRFKGVPDGQQIYEVGEPGIAPLRTPPNTPKAWRDLPLWRRPAALAAEAAIIAGIGVGVWFATRPAPAIAFNQRDWVVVADLRNLTGQSVLDDSLEQAFRISLEQSRYVNVLSDLKARDTLARMQLKPDTVLDRAIASEIALRDGARAVILPTVAEVGGKVRVSAEIIDPHTQTTILSEAADGTDLSSALDSIDRVTASLREKLGETVKTIERDSKPLPQVTTSNLDALRAYALAQEAYAKRDFAQALELYKQATDLDPQFALSWIGQMRVHYSEVDAPAGVAALRRAQEARSRLAPREAMYLDAWVARFDDPARATDKWLNLAKLYPDYDIAQSNAAMWMFMDNRFNEAVQFASAALVPQNATPSIDYDILGRAHLAMGNLTAATKAFDNAISRGYDSALRRRAVVDASHRKFTEAWDHLAKVPLDDRHGYLERASVSIDEGKWDQARRYASTGLEMARKAGGVDSRAFLLPAAVAEWRSGSKEAALSHVRSAADQALGALRAGKGITPDAQDDAEIAVGRREHRRSCRTRTGGLRGARVCVQHRRIPIRTYSAEAQACRETARRDRTATATSGWTRALSDARSASSGL